MSGTRYNTAVMASRREPPDSLDFFPTPPPATRALVEDVLMPLLNIGRGDLASVREPAAGQGHMAEILRDYFRVVYASDIFDYGVDYPTCDYLARGLALGDDAPRQVTDWVITNPPYNLAADFLERALSEASVGVALLLRTSWSEGEERFERIFKKRAPQIVAQFSERIAMLKGRWDPAASSATAYAWYVWWKPMLETVPNSTRLVWIAPGVKRRHTKQADVRRFARPA